MRKKIKPKFLGIVLCFVLGTILFAFHSCTREQPDTDQPVSLGISYEDGAASWSPDGNYLTFTYGHKGGGNRPGRPAPGANICICDLKTGKWTLITTDGKHNKEPDWVVVSANGL
jgi:hypothetical protein